MSVFRHNLGDDEEFKGPFVSQSTVVLMYPHDVRLYEVQVEIVPMLSDPTVWNLCR